MSAPKTTAARNPARRPVNVSGIVLAMALLGIAVTAFTGTAFWVLATGAVKWGAAGAIALVGLLLLATAGRHRRT